MSLKAILFDNKQALVEVMQFMPEGVAEAVDYEQWGKTFIACLVSDRIIIAQHP
jgi:hypothetical protein